MKAAANAARNVLAHKRSFGGAVLAADQRAFLCSCHVANVASSLRVALELPPVFRNGHVRCKNQYQQVPTTTWLTSETVRVRRRVVASA